MEQWVVLDIETTGFHPEINKITEIGALKIAEGKVIDRFTQLINPQEHIPEEITQLTGISNEMVRNMPAIDTVLPEFIDFCDGFDIMGHNILFDYSFIKYNALQRKLKFNKKGVDTLYIARTLLNQLEKKSLSYLCDYYKIERELQHRAFDDAQATYTLYCKMEREFKTEQNKDLFSSKLLHWKPQKQEPITQKQEKYLLHLATLNQVELIKPIQEFSKSEASRQIDLIIREYGNERQRG